MIFLINSILFAEVVGAVSKQYSPHILDNTLIIYKDKCLATIKFQSIASKKISLFNMPNSLDYQSILFKINQRLPEYYLKKYDQDTRNDLAILHDDGTALEGEFSYIFSGISWHMHYCMEINSAMDKILNFNGFINVDNKNNNDFENANLHFVEANSDYLEKNQKFKEYKVNGKREIYKNSFVKIPWVEMRDQCCEHDYRIDVGGENLKDLNGNEKLVPLHIWLTFDSSFEGKKSIASGDVEIYIRDKDNILRSLGGSTLTTVSEDGAESIRLSLPSSLLMQLSNNTNSPISKIKGTLEQTEFKVLMADKISEAAYRVTIKNSDDKAISIKVVLPFDKMQCKIIKENIEHQMESDNIIYWPVKVEPKSEVMLRYKVQLTHKG